MVAVVLATVGESVIVTILLALLLAAFAGWVASHFVPQPFPALVAVVVFVLVFFGAG